MEILKQDFSQKVKASSEIGLKVNNDLRRTSRVVSEWLKDNKIMILERTSTQ